MNNSIKGGILKAFAVFIDVSVPLVATLTQFPVWVQRSSEATVSGLFLVFAFLSCLPFLRQIREYMRSPSVLVIWAVLLVLFLCLKNIIVEMIVVCFAGLCANIVGAILYRIGKAVSKKESEL